MTHAWARAGTSSNVIRAALLGHRNLPWEDASEGSLSALRTLRHSVMSCLCRYAERRPNADELAASWRNLLEFSAVKHTVGTPLELVVPERHVRKNVRN